ncbi:AsmA family protein [Orenia marismortui]|uniref:AsmA family protein n=1 Tax=Orenia marismortui TaxID=46469 RepID=UPI00036D9214|nr:AsmA-like C-terminal region-containing protein [Orenia marismortui]
MKSELEKDKLSLKKISFYLCIIIFIMLLTGVFYLKSYFDSDKLASLVIPKLEESLSREVKIRDIKLKFIGGIGVKVDGIIISKSLDFEEGNLAELDSLNLDFALLPLLNKEVKIKDLTLVRPIIYLEKDRVSKTNHNSNSDISKSNSKKGVNPVFNLDKLEIVNAQIKYIDRQKGSVIELDNFSSELTISLDQDNKLSTAGKSTIGRLSINNSSQTDSNIEDLNLSLKHDLIYNLANKKVEVRRFDLGLDQLDLKSQFNLILGKNQLKIGDFKAKAGDSSLNFDADLRETENPSLDINLNSDIYLEDLLAKLPIEFAKNLSGNIKADLSLKNIRINQVKDNLQNMKLSGDISLDKFNLDDKLAIKDISALVQISEQEIKSDDLKLAIAKDIVNAKIKINKWKELLADILNQREEVSGSINLDLAAEGLNLDKILDNKKDNQAKVDPSKAEEKKVYLPKLNLYSKINIDSLEYQEDEYEDIMATIELEDSIVNLEELSLSQGDSNLLTSGTVDYSQFSLTNDFKSIDFDLNVNSDINLAKIRRNLLKVVPKLKRYDFSGRLNSDLSAEFLLSDIMEDPLSNLDKINIYGDIAVSGNNIELPQMENTIESLKGKFKFNKQSLEVRDFNFNLAKSDLSAKVSIGDWRDTLLVLLKKKEATNSKAVIELNSKLISIDEFLALLFNNSQGVQKEEKDSGEVKKSTPKIPIIMQADIDALRYSSLVVSNINTKGRLSNELLEVDKLNLGINGGSITAKGQLDFSPNKPEYQGDLKIDQIEINQVLSLFTNFNNKLYGKTNLTTKFGGRGFSLEDILNSLTLQGTALIKDGELKGWGLVNKLNNSFNLFDEESLAFKDLQGNIDLRDGRLYLDDFSADTKLGDIKLVGSSTLAGKVDYQLDYLLSNKESKELNLNHKELFYAPDTTRVELNFKIKGSVLKPEFRWDKGDIEKKIKEKAKDKVEEKTKEEIDKAKDKIKKELEDKKDDLKDIFKGLF